VRPRGRSASESWGLTADERARLAAAPAEWTPEGWTAFAAAIQEVALKGYAAGEMTFRQLMEVERGSALAARRRRGSI